MRSIPEQKKELRGMYRALGAQLTPEYRREADRTIRDAVLRTELWRSAEGVFLYVSMWAEPDTRALIEAALDAGKRVYVPLCLADRSMAAVRIRSMAELRPGTLGIPEPPENGERAGAGDIDLALIPCVAAARSGARLGHGAGYYDRFLRLHPCRKLCLCYEKMLADELPEEEHDIRMDAVVSEKGI